MVFPAPCPSTSPPRECESLSVLRLRAEAEGLASRAEVLGFRVQRCRTMLGDVKCVVPVDRVEAPLFLPQKEPTAQFGV